MISTYLKSNSFCLTVYFKTFIISLLYLLILGVEIKNYESVFPQLLGSTREGIPRGGRSCLGAKPGAPGRLTEAHNEMQKSFLFVGISIFLEIAFIYAKKCIIQLIIAIRIAANDIYTINCKCHG